MIVFFETTTALTHHNLLQETLTINNSCKTEENDFIMVTRETRATVDITT
jgi:hypothetical protein